MTAGPIYYRPLDPDPDEVARILAPVAIEVLATAANPAQVFADTIASWAGDDFVSVEILHSPKRKAWLPVMHHARLGRLSPGEVHADGQLEAWARLWIGYASAAHCDLCGRRVAALTDGCPPVAFPYAGSLLIRPACQPPQPLPQPDVTSAG